MQSTLDQTLNVIEIFMIVKLCEMKLVQAPNNQLVNNYGLCLAVANTLLRNTLPVVLSTKGEELDFYDYLKAIETSAVLVDNNRTNPLVGLSSGGGTGPRAQALRREVGPRDCAKNVDNPLGSIRRGRGGN